MLKQFARIMLLVVFVTSLTVVSAQDEEVRDVPFFLTFVPNIQFSPLYVAIENGYVAQQGLRITIEHGDENVGVDLIAAGEIPFGMISGEQVILAHAGGRPVVYVYEWFQEYPVGIVVPNTTEGVESVTDLDGRRVGIPGRFGASYSGLTALLSANEMSEFDITLEPIGFAAPDVVCAGGVEASVIYVNNEPLQIQERAAAGECGDITDIRVIRVADTVDMVSNGIVTNEDAIENNPELVQAMVTAFDAGLRDAINNPAQAYLISLDYVENLPITDEFRAALETMAETQAAFLIESPDRVAIAESRAQMYADLSEIFDRDLLTQFRVLLETIVLWDADQLGFTDADSWEQTQAVLQELDMMPGSVDLETVYTNDFLPEADQD